MAYYISVHPFNKTKHDQTWDEILHGNFSEKSKEEISSATDELDIVLKNPKIATDWELQKREGFLQNRIHLLSRLIDYIDKLKKAIVNQDDELIKEYVSEINDKITTYFTEISYSDSRYPFHEFFSGLFKVILDIDIGEDYQDTLSLLPHNKWIELYEKINPEAVKKAIGATEDNPEDVEGQKYYLNLAMHIRDILRNCVKTKSEIKIYDELFNTDREEFGDDRTKEVISQFIKK